MELPFLPKAKRRRGRPARRRKGSIWLRLFDELLPMFIGAALVYAILTFAR